MADESKARNQVVLVVDRNFGSRLEETAKRHHTWIVETPPNRFVAETVWKQAIAYSVNRGVTTFIDDPFATPEELVVNMLGSIEEHHPDLNRLEVQGARFTPTLKVALAELGFGSVVNLEDGFLISR